MLGQYLASYIHDIELKLKPDQHKHGKVQHGERQAPRDLTPTIEQQMNSSKYHSNGETNKINLKYLFSNITKRREMCC